MSPRTVRQAITAVLGLGVTADITYQLADHNAPIAVITAVAFSLLSNTIFLTHRTVTGDRPRTFECGQPGCNASITVNGSLDRAPSFYKGLIDNHARSSHPGTSTGV